MRTKYPLLIIVVAIVLSPGMFPVPSFSQAVFYQGKTLKIINNDPGGVVSLRVNRHKISEQIYSGGIRLLLWKLWKVAAAARRPITYSKTPMLFARSSGPELIPELQ